MAPLITCSESRPFGTRSAGMPGGPIPLCFEAARFAGRWWGDRFLVGEEVIGSRALGIPFYEYLPSVNDFSFVETYETYELAGTPLRGKTCPTSCPKKRKPSRGITPERASDLGFYGGPKRT